MENKKNMKLLFVLKYLIVVAIIVLYVLYYVFNWNTLALNFNKVLDAVIKSIGLIAILIVASKLCAVIIPKIGKTNRSVTATKLVASMMKYVIAIVGVVTILSYFIADTSTLVTGVSMLTLVVGLGAQSLTSDIVSGIFIVFEGDYKVGDVVVIDGWRGVVNEIGLRTTKIEDAGGNVQIINNSQISKIINNSKNLSTAICDVGIEYGESIIRVENILEKAFPKIKDRIPAIAEGPFYKGVALLGDSSVVLKIIAKCKEDDKFQVQRDINREIKLLFDENNVGIPFPQITLSHLVENDVNVTTKQRKKADQFVEDQKELSAGIEEING